MDPVGIEPTTFALSARLHHQMDSGPLSAVSVLIRVRERYKPPLCTDTPRMVRTLGFQPRLTGA